MHNIALKYFVYDILFLICIITLEVGIVHVNYLSEYLTYNEVSVKNN